MSKIKLTFDELSKICGGIKCFTAPGFTDKKYSVIVISESGHPVAFNPGEESQAAYLRRGIFSYNKINLTEKIVSKISWYSFCSWYDEHQTP